MELVLLNGCKSKRIFFLYINEADDIKQMLEWFGYYYI